MDFTFLLESINPIVVTACCMAGYLLKHAIPNEVFQNKFIPLVLPLLGVVLFVLEKPITLENIVFGAVCGGLATYLHEAFRAFLGGK